MSNERNTLDFYVIGAKKAGTTSLYYYFSKMPELCMHSCKELSFLSTGFEESGSFERVVTTQYKAADPDRVWGAVTPHYLYDNLIPEKLKRFMPNGKFVVILRDPIERAISNYHMMLVQGREIGDIDDVINSQLDSAHVTRQRTREFYHGADLDSYVVWGEYGRLLESFLEVNSRENLLVCFLEELANDPPSEFTRICRFIGAGNSVMPENLGVTYNNSRRRSSFFRGWYDSLRDNKLVRNLGRKVIPVNIRRELIYRYSLHANGCIEKATLSIDTEERLVTHFRSDVRKLESLIGRSAPWARFATGARLSRHN
jgi:hypothetical protein